MAKSAESRSNNVLLLGILSQKIGLTANVICHEEVKLSNSKYSGHVFFFPSNQFPLDRETPLDRAIALLQSPGKITINMAESLPDVVKAINTYKAAQDEIMKGVDNVNLFSSLAFIMSCQ